MLADTFNPDGMEREKDRGRTAVLERPKLDPGKKYKVILFNDNKNTRQYVIDTLVRYAPVHIDRTCCLLKLSHKNRKLYTHRF
jgi:ATP-dependent Clp protease adapter protein ClpS